MDQGLGTVLCSSCWNQVVHCVSSCTVPRATTTDPTASAISNVKSTELYTSKHLKKIYIYFSIPRRNLIRVISRYWYFQYKCCAISLKDSVWLNISAITFRGGDSELWEQCWQLALSSTSAWVGNREALLCLPQPLGKEASLLPLELLQVFAVCWLVSEWETRTGWQILLSVCVSLSRPGENEELYSLKYFGLQPLASDGDFSEGGIA